MGVVLKAIDKSLDRTVAIKVLAAHLATSGAARKRFAREAKAAAAVLHPNVIAIHSVSNDEVLPYLVMPYVRGTSLQKRLDREGPLAVTEMLEECLAHVQQPGAVPLNGTHFERNGASHRFR